MAVDPGWPAGGGNWALQETEKKRNNTPVQRANLMMIFICRKKNKLRGYHRINYGSCYLLMNFLTFVPWSVVNEIR